METKESSAFFHKENAMFDMQKIGERIAKLRRERDLTQADLAEWLGISYQAVSSWERGATMPDISKLVELSRALGTTVDALLTGEEKEAPVRTADTAPEEEPKAAEQVQPNTEEKTAEAENEEIAQEENLDSFSGSLQDLMARMKVQLSDQMQAMRDKLHNMQLQFSGAEVSCGEENGKPVITIEKKKKDGGVTIVVSSDDDNQSSRGRIKSETIGAMASNMDQELLEDVLVDAINDENEEIVEEIACYLEADTIERALERADEELTDEMLSELAVYMGGGALEKCALQALEDDDAERMEEIACHLEEEVLVRALERFVGEISCDMVEALACYASESAMNLIIEKCDLDDEDTVEALAPYLNQRQMRALLKRLRNS